MEELKKNFKRFLKYLLLMSYLCVEKWTDCACLENIIVAYHNDPLSDGTDKQSQTKTNADGILHGRKYFV